MIMLYDKVRHLSGAWACGCDDTIGEVVALNLDLDDEEMAKVATPCFGGQWIPLRELAVVTPFQAGDDRRPAK